jgi:hypothetical protein
MTNPLKIETVKLSSLIPDPTNARQHDARNLNAIVGSLKLFGQRKPIVVTGANVIVAGNGTVEAAKELGWQEIMIVRTPKDWSPEQIKAYALADNRTAELAEWDVKVLSEQLLELDSVGWDVSEFGFEPLQPPTEVVDDEPLSFEEVETRCKPNDLWVLGDHKLLCGDSLEVTAMDRLLGSEKADIVWTDPPYGVDYVGKTKDALKIENDNKTFDELEDFLRAAFNNIYQATRPGACWYVAAPSGDLFLAFARPLKELGVWRHTLVWVKDTLVMGRADYHYRHESIFYG